MAYLRNHHPQNFSYLLIAVGGCQNRHQPNQALNNRIIVEENLNLIASLAFYLNFMISFLIPALDILFLIVIAVFSSTFFIIISALSSDLETWPLLFRLPEFSILVYYSTFLIKHQTGFHTEKLPPLL